MKEQNTKDHEAFIETYKYLYRNPLTRFFHEFGHYVVQLLIKNKDGKIIDLGCGSGEHFRYIKNHDIVGIDVDEELLETARKKYPDISLYKENIDHLSFKDEQFDSAVAIFVLEHLVNLSVALSEIKRILKPGGELIMIIPTENFIYKLGREITVKRYVEKKCEVDYNELIAGEHVNQCKDIIKLLKSNFNIDKMVGVPFLVPFINTNIFIAARCKKK